jgi:ubiquinone/menaquinone biosynthesis C-methylase UbiE
MMSFDRVADVYDATRGLPPGVDEAVADRIVAATSAGPETRFLEIGVGTGRIALPLIRRGYPFTGVDISTQMLDRLRDKAGSPPNLTLIEADIRELPLEDNSQDVVLAIHVFHLVEQWEQALEEALRVLKPRGHFIFGGNVSVGTDTRPDWGRIRQEWGRLVQEMGASVTPRHGEWYDVQEALTARGGRIAVYRAASWMREFRPIDLMEAMRRRTFSASWAVPEEVLEAAHPKLLSWGAETYGDVHATIAEEEEFLLDVCRFEG